MDPTVLTGFATNLGSFAVALGVYVLWKRLESCNSSCHTSWFTCESLAQRQKKERKKVDLYKRALAEFQRESIKQDHGTLEISDERSSKSPDSEKRRATPVQHHRSTPRSSVHRL